MMADARIEYRWSVDACCGGHMPGCYCREWAPYPEPFRLRSISAKRAIAELKRHYPLKYEFRIVGEGD